MPFYPKRYRKRRPRIGRKARKTTYRKKVAKLSKPMIKAVKNVVHRMVENKMWERVGINVALNGAVSGVTSVDPICLNLLPWLSQGVGQSGRIGNRVRLVKNHFKGIINLLPIGGSATNQAPVYVKLWVFSPKAFTNFTGDMGNLNWKQFFQVNNADTGFYGNNLDMLQNVNTELYTVHTTRTFCLSSWNTQGSAGQYSSFTSPYSVKFDLNLVKYVKDLRFDDDSSTRPTNKNLLIAFQTCYADGTINGIVSNNNVAELHYVQECEYEDL